jgi:hypothetical protein
MRQRWKILTPPLLCGSLAALCLALAPDRLRSDLTSIKPLNHFVILLIGAEAIWEVYLSFTQHPRRLIDRGSVQIGIIRLPAYIVPYSPHLGAACMLLTLLMIGLCIELRAIAAICLPLKPAIAVRAQAMGGVGLAMGGPALLFSLWRVFDRSLGLTLCSAGVTLRSGLIQWHVPWEIVEEIRPMKLKLLAGRGPLVLGLRVTDAARMQLPEWVRQRSGRMIRKTGWHCIWPLFTSTLTVREAAYLLNYYRLQPHEQSKIGTEAELANVKAILNQVSRESW